MVEQQSKDFQVGFHRGAISVLGAEQNELMKLINITQQIAQAHIKALKDLGVDIEAEMKKAAEEYQKQQTAQQAEKQAPQAQPEAPQPAGTQNPDDLADRLA